MRQLLSQSGDCPKSFQVLSSTYQFCVSFVSREPSVLFVYHESGESRFILAPCGQPLASQTLVTGTPFTSQIMKASYISPPSEPRLTAEIPGSFPKRVPISI